MIPCDGGQNVSLPFALGPPRVDQTKKKNTCLTSDIGISENSFAQCQKNPEFLKMVVDIASKNMQENFLKGELMCWRKSVLSGDRHCIHNYNTSRVGRLRRQRLHEAPMETKKTFLFHHAQPLSSTNTTLIIQATRR